MCSRASRLLSCASKILYRSSTSYTCRVLEPRIFLHRRTFSSDNNPKKSDENFFDTEDEQHNLSGAIGSQYETFRDEDSTTIFDVDEEKKKMIDLEEINVLQEFRDPYEGLNMKRGIRGVYDIDDLVQLLRRDKARDIFVIAVPQELSYVDYIVIVTGKSVRHMSALATFVRKVFKVKANSKDILPKIEGANCKDWMALDLGNIALHIFSKEARTTYDLETLWSVGGKFDIELNKPDAEQEFEASYSKFLTGMHPADG